MVTDEQLNHAVAEVLRNQSSSSEVATTDANPPDYCNDGNTLPKLWAAIEIQGRDVQDDFAGLLRDYATKFRHDRTKTVMFVSHTLPCRVHVEMALKALGKWQSEWDDE